MLKRTVVSAIVMAAMATVSIADVTLIYDPATIDPDVTTTVAISLMANPDIDWVGIGGIGFAYDDGSDAYIALDPSNFGWTPEIMHDQNQWFITEGLPSPEAAAFFPGAAVPMTDGETVQFASIDFSPGPHEAVTVYSLASNMTVFDENVGELTVKGGDPQDITVLPEPASLSLLALGALAIVRRRR